MFNQVIINDYSKHNCECITICPQLLKYGHRCRFFGRTGTAAIAQIADAIGHPLVYHIDTTLARGVADDVANLCFERHCH
jgi:hypothetical protein